MRVSWLLMSDVLSLHPQVFPLLPLFAACNAATANQEPLKPERWLLIK